MIVSLRCLNALQVFTTKEPFQHLQYWKDRKVREAVLLGSRPPRPGPEITALGLTDAVWALVEDCWAQDPEDRPPMSEVLARLERMEKTWKEPTFTPVDRGLYEEIESDASEEEDDQYDW